MNTIIATGEFFTLKDFFYTFLSAIAGVVIGVVWTEWRAATKEKKRKKEELRLLREVLLESKKLATQALQQYQARTTPPGIPNFTLDVSGLVRRVDRLQGLVPSAMIAAVDGLRYQMEHASIKMVTIYQMAASGQNAVAHPEYASCQAHLGQIVGWVDQRLEDVALEESKDA